MARRGRWQKDGDGGDLEKLSGIQQAKKNGGQGGRSKKFAMGLVPFLPVGGDGSWGGDDVGDYRTGQKLRLISCATDSLKCLERERKAPERGNSSKHNVIL